MDFLLGLIEIFSVGITASRYEQSDRKSAISLQRGHFDPEFQLQGVDRQTERILVMGINYSKTSLTTITFSVTLVVKLYS